MMKKITVKKYMTEKSSPSFDFMKKWNDDNPMPMRTMYGVKIQETKGMVKMVLHADMLENKVKYCMKCGRVITNEVSQYFGLGPECGKHNYINPFNTDEELHNAVNNYRKELQKVTWTGWIIKSAIIDSIDVDEVEDFTSTITSSYTSSEKKSSIKVDIRKATNLYEKKSLYVSFEYNSKIVSLIKNNFTTRYYIAKTHEWELPESKLGQLKDTFKDYTLIITGDVTKEEVAKKEIEIPKGFTFKTTPFLHQIDGFKYGLSHNAWLLGDEQGLGKTKQCIDIAIAKKFQNDYKHCLIICGVNGLKWNWQNEIKTHSNESGYILGQRISGNKITIGSTTDKYNDLKNINKINDYFLITNIETLRNEDIVNELKKLCNNKTIGMIAIDEIHKAKNPSSQQGKGLLKLTEVENKLAMTGTPLMNNPMDLYIILKWLGYENHALYSFRNHYCNMGGFGGYQIISYKNLPELQDRLNAIMLRRLKQDVLDLPEKLYIDEYVDMTDKQSIIYKETSSIIRAHIDQIKMANNPLAELIRMRQATGYTGILSSDINESAKFNRVEELVEEITSNGKKVVIFSNWTQITTPLTKLLSKYNPITITGETKDSDRQSLVDKFQTDNNTRVAIGTIGAMGTGITLTAASTVIFMDEPWTMAAKQQAIDRCHRIGTKENVTIYTIMCKNTIDEKIHNIVNEKGEISDWLVDGKNNFNKSNMIDYLLD